VQKRTRPKPTFGNPIRHVTHCRQFPGLERLLLPFHNLSANKRIRSLASGPAGRPLARRELTRHRRELWSVDPSRWGALQGGLHEAAPILRGPYFGSVKQRTFRFERCFSRLLYLDAEKTVI
jgi:hypothetical protein